MAKSTLHDTQATSEVITSAVTSNELRTTSEKSAKRPLESIAKELNLTKTEVECAKLLRGWPVGFEVTDSDLIAAVEAAKNVQIR